MEVAGVQGGGGIRPWAAPVPLEARARLSPKLGLPSTGGSSSKVGNPSSSEASRRGVKQEGKQRHSTLE